MNIGEVLAKAWKIIWKHKVLFIFGILAGCGQSNNWGGGNSGYQFSKGDRNFSGELPNWMRNLIERFSNLSEGQLVNIIMIVVLVGLLLIVLAIFLSTVGRIGLIRGAQQADGGAEKLIFGELFSGSMPFFWRVFGLNLLVGLAMLTFLLFFILPFTLLGFLTEGVGLLCILPFFCLLLAPLSWLVTLIVEQANIAIVVENVGITEGLRRGWKVFRENLGIMILIALILFLGVRLIGGIIISLPLIAVVVPAAIALFSRTPDVMRGGLLIAGLCFVAYLPVLLVLSVILSSYFETAWTLTYLRLKSKASMIEQTPSAS